MVRLSVGSSCPPFEQPFFPGTFGLRPCAAKPASISFRMLRCERARTAPVLGRLLGRRECIRQAQDLVQVPDHRADVQQGDARKLAEHVADEKISLAAAKPSPTSKT